MTAELIISLVSLITSFICSVATIIMTFKVAQVNNTEALHKYEKKITKFELSFRDEAWFYGIIYSGEFSNYTDESQKLIFEWWKEYKKTHKPKKVKQPLPESKDFSGERFRAYQPPKKGKFQHRRFPTVARPGEVIANVEAIVIEPTIED